MKHRLAISLPAAVVLLIVAAGAAWAAVQQGQAPAWPDYFVQGTIGIISGEQITVETGEGGSATLLVDDRTRQWLPGSPPTTTLTLATGDPVLALGEPAGDGSLAARLILVAPAEDLPKYVLQGRVLAVTAQTVVVEARRGERAITILPRTQIRSVGGRLNSPRDIRAGDRLLAVGQPNELGQWLAGTILVAGSSQPVGATLQGEVTAIDLETGTLTVETPRGAVTVKADDGTRYHVPGIEEPVLADVQVGDRIVAQGRYDREAGIFLARILGVRPSVRESSRLAVPDA